MNRLIAGALSAPLFALLTMGDALANGQGGLFGWMMGEDKAKPVVNPTYLSECGGCHAPFPAWMMPADAWQRIMGALKHHFENDVTLDKAATTELNTYLAANAAKGDSAAVFGAAMAKTAPASRKVTKLVLPRVTDATPFKERHAEISVRSVKANPKIVSFANCQGCHRQADQGSFNEEDVDIPSMR